MSDRDLRTAKGRLLGFTPWLAWGLVLAVPLTVLGQSELDESVQSATTVLDEIMSAPARQIPESLLARAHAVAIVPKVVKGGFVLGVRHGRGVLLIRDDNGQWLPPIFVSLTGGSVGWQVGIQSTDVILVFRTRQSINNLRKGRLTIGVDVAGAAGPVGRQASAATDATLSAEILSYSRSRGLFGGVSFDGSALQIDNDAGLEYYRRPIISATGQAVYNPSELPAAASDLMRRLTRYSGADVLNRSNEPGRAQSAVAIEAVRTELSSSWQELALLLDDQWRAFLAPPREVMTPGIPINAAAMDEILRRYQETADNPRYASLAGRREFAKTYELLQKLAIVSREKNSKRLSLPPPPPGKRY